MQSERLTEEIILFHSDKYAQVTAGVLLTSAGAVLIDTLLYPEESQRIRRYVEKALGYQFAYVINTHFHADHSTGTCFFPGAQVISHRLCRDLLDTRGREALQQLQESDPDFAGVSIVLPSIVFDDKLRLCLGDTAISMWSSPGHSPDSIVCLVEEAGVLFAADTLMPLPYFVDGDPDDFKRSLNQLRSAAYEFIVQGHGGIILPGEIAEKIDSDLAYLQRLEAAVEAYIGLDAADAAERISPQACGKSHVLLNGLVGQLHRQNVGAMLARMKRLKKQAGLLL